MLSQSSVEKCTANTPVWPFLRVHWRVHYGLKNMGYMVYLLNVGASS